MPRGARKRLQSQLKHKENDAKLPEYRKIQISEFFKERKHLAGFSNQARALYQTVRELVENALDATDMHGIFPEILIVIQKVDGYPEYYRVEVEDNGIGVDPRYVPLLFGKVLYSSKYVLKQSRGTFGIGAKIAIIYGQDTTGYPTEIYTSPIGSPKIYYFKLKIDIKENTPMVLERKEYHKGSNNWHGTRISLVIKGDWSRSKSKIHDYIKRTAIVTPYATITLIDPDNTVTVYRRVLNKLPKSPVEAKLHPHGVDFEKLRELMSKSNADTLYEFLVETFQGVGRQTALDFLHYLKINPNSKLKELDEDSIRKLVEALKTYKKFRSPKADSLSPLGVDTIIAGLKAILKPDIVVAVSRRPSAYSGHPFIVEIGIAYGGEIPSSDEPILLRYTNRVPLLYSEKSDVAWKIVDPNNFDWKNYLVKFPAPLAVLTHIASTKIPYTELGKESVAEVPEIEHELRNALRDAARKLRKHLLELEREKEAQKKVITYAKYIPEVAKSLFTITHTDSLSLEDIQMILLENMKRRLGLSEEKFSKIVKSFEVKVEE